MIRLSDTLALAEAALWLTLAHLAIHALPFGRLAGLVGQAGRLSPEPDEARRSQALHFGGMVERAARRHPLRPQCLAQGIAAKRMLRRRGVETTLHFGMRRRGSAPAGQPLRPPRDIAPHAWLQAGETVVLGEDVDRHTVVARFT